MLLINFIIVRIITFDCIAAFLTFQSVFLFSIYNPPEVDRGGLMTSILEM